MTRRNILVALAAAWLFTSGAAERAEAVGGSFCCGFKPGLEFVGLNFVEVFESCAEV